MKWLPFVLITLVTLPVMSQNESQELPYAEIPEYPEKYTACTVAARMIDGLGFRYYWATEGLTDDDLNYRPTEASRSTAETIDHMLGLSKVILNASLKKPNQNNAPDQLSFDEKRAFTLQNLKRAADILREADDLSEFTIIFDRQGTTSEFPYWNNINGPIADAIWHAGQVVVLRRSSGNPINPNVSVFQGKVRQ